MNGLRKAIAYSLRPHELGFCGPQSVEKSKVILGEYLLGKKHSEKLIRELLDEFLGAVSYFRLIARSNNIEDYFDDKVIEAYWIGNKLLERVSPKQLKEMILNNFTDPKLLAKEKARQIAERIPAGVAAHHSFHVFYVGSVTGRVKITPSRKDKCKVSWGKITNVDIEKKKVEIETVKLFPRKREVKLKMDWNGKYLPGLKKGDLISAHWGRVSEKLTPREYRNLASYTLLNYKQLSQIRGKK